MAEEGRSANYFLLVFYLSIFVLIVFLFLFFQDNPDFLTNIVKTYGLIGLFVATIIATSTVLLPLPIDLLIVLIGANPAILGYGVFGPVEIFGLALLVGFGAAIGEMTAYTLGLVGGNVLRMLSKKDFEKLDNVKKDLQKYGAMLVFVCAITPFPFDLVGIAAGLVKFDAKKLFFAAFFGKTIRYFVLLLASNIGSHFILGIFGLGGY